ncbi:MAG TPA: bifunctional oligoribonuclease/PAP phosphatase NrnA [Clostridiales bacterium]|jgi:phosphoesterase RecJ-like protein|nr:bifunctional oligoribonuclease/PAP phosphatase NrnA [Clostridiales bacterium]
MLKSYEGINAISEFIKQNDGFALIIHISPDGDSVGSGLALYSALKLMNKQCAIICQDRIPHTYSFLPYSEEIITPDKASRFETAIAIDCADISRLGSATKLFEAAKNTISIDHHSTNSMFAMHNEVHPYLAATGEIIFELIKNMLGFVSSQIADCLYTSIMTDTGNFSFTNTSSNTFEIAAELLRFGAKPAELNTLVYRNVPLAKTKLLGFALSTFELKRNDRIAISVITQQDLQRYNAKGDYAEGIIDHLRDIETVEIAILMRECQDGSYKVGLRSKGESDVAALAQNFGGGGHVHAAGFKTDMPFETLYDMVVSAAIEALEA